MNATTTTNLNANTMRNSYVDMKEAKSRFEATVREVRRLHDVEGLTYKEIDVLLFASDTEHNHVSYEVFYLTSAARAVLS